MKLTSRQIYIIAATCMVAAVCVGGVLMKRQSRIIEPVRKTQSILEVPDFRQPISDIDTTPFIEDVRASSMWVTASSTAKATDGRVIAGIVNHHTLAADLIASFFANLKISRPDLQRIIIISPDHFKTGRDELSTHIRSYRVGSEEVQIDAEAVRLLVSSGVAVEEDGAMFEREHGIGALAPFIVRAYPNIKIVPIAFRGDLSKSRSRLLSDVLKSLWDDKTVIVISADMSHYLDRSVALKNDEVTYQLLQRKDPSIASSTDGYIDSGRSVAALFVAMNEAHPDARFIRFAHSISSEYGGDPTYTTSYMTGVWEKDVRDEK